MVDWAESKIRLSAIIMSNIFSFEVNTGIHLIWDSEIPSVCGQRKGLVRLFITSLSFFWQLLHCVTVFLLVSTNRNTDKKLHATHLDKWWFFKNDFCEMQINKSMTILNLLSNSKIPCYLQYFKNGISYKVLFIISAWWVFSILSYM